MVADLQYVIVGNNMLEGRGHGPYFAGNFRGSSGFRPEMQDEFNQVQHAIAGVVIGYKYGAMGATIAYMHEDEPQDVRLYGATIPLGRHLNDANYRELGRRLELTIAPHMR